MCVMTLFSRITNTCDPPQLRTRDMAYTRLCMCVCIHMYVLAYVFCQKEDRAPNRIEGYPWFAEL